MANTLTYTDRYGNEVDQAELFRDKNEDEITALKYFYAIDMGGCFSKKYVTDDEYLALVDKLVGDMATRKATALSRLGLDEDEVSEIEPVCFQGYAFLDAERHKVQHQYMRLTKNGNRVVTATKELCWLFFGDQQVYVYKVRVDTIDHALKSESTQEYFYRDVTAFASQSDSVREKYPVMKDGCFGSTVEFKEKAVEAEVFRIVVPGEVFTCALSPEDDNAAKIASMKQKLREKKNS